MSTKFPSQPTRSRRRSFNPRTLRPTPPPPTTPLLTPPPLTPPTPAASPTRASSRPSPQAPSSTETPAISRPPTEGGGGRACSCTVASCGWTSEQLQRGDKGLQSDLTSDLLHTNNLYLDRPLVRVRGRHCPRGVKGHSVTLWVFTLQEPETVNIHHGNCRFNDCATFCSLRFLFSFCRRGAWWETPVKPGVPLPPLKQRKDPLLPEQTCLYSRFTASVRPSWRLLANTEIKATPTEQVYPLSVSSTAPSNTTSSSAVVRPASHILL